MPGNRSRSLAQFRGRDEIHELQRGSAAHRMLLDDGIRVLPAREQERRDRRRHVAAMSAISESAIGPGPLGIADTSPIADAPALIASRASSRLAIQQILTNSGPSVYRDTATSPYYVHDNPERGLRRWRRPAGMGSTQRHRKAPSRRRDAGGYPPADVRTSRLARVRSRRAELRGGRQPFREGHRALPRRNARADPRHPRSRCGPSRARCAWSKSWPRPACTFTCSRTCR